MSTSASYSRQLAQWTRALRFEDLPADVVSATKYRVLDVIGLALAGVTMPFGCIARALFVRDESAGPEPVDRIGAARRRRACRVRERCAVAGARVRRHAQRIHRAHE
jgi:2-methylcitrate dehydratase PrpD